MKITRDFLIQNLADSGLMSADDASSLCESLSTISGPADSDTVAQELAGTDALTAYQAECVCRGETSGLVFGDYVVLEKIGQGGMGVVLKGQHRRMDRIVAIKKLTAAALESEGLVKRFYQEVKASARLLHPNVVTALDAREHEGVHYLIMEYIEGRDLAEVLKERGPLPVDEAVNYVVQAAQGLEFAHKHGVFHRDIKPSNLMLTSASGGREPTGTSTNQPADAGRSPADGTPQSAVVKILDMGLARIVSEAKGNEGGQEQLTSDDQVMGTCDYMAPEQAENTKDVDHRADIYSLGCTLYRLLTNSPPYTGGNLMQLLLAHREHPIPSICNKRPDMPASVDAVFRKMVAKTRETRYQSMTEVIEALQTALGRGPAPAAAPAPDPGLTDFLKQIHQEPSGVSRGGRGAGKNDAVQAAATVQEQADPITDETVDLSATADTDPSTITRQPSTPTTPAARPQNPATRRKKKQTQMLLLIGVGIGLSLIGAAVVAAVLYVQTNYGTVVVTTDDQDIHVLVKRGGQLYVADAKNQWRVEVKSGEYSVELKGGNDRFVLDKDTITVTRGGEVRVRVELKPRQVAEPAKTSPESVSEPTTESKGIAEYCRRIRECWVQRDFARTQDLVWPEGWVFAGVDPATQELVVTDSNESLETFLTTVDEVVALNDPPVYEVQGPLAVVSWRKARLRGDGWEDVVDGVDVVVQHEAQWRYVFGMYGDWNMTSDDRYDPDNSDHVALQRLLDLAGEAMVRKDAGAIRRLTHPDNRNVIAGPDGPIVLRREDFTDETFGNSSVDKHQHTITAVKVLGPLAVTLTQLDHVGDGESSKVQGHLNIYGRTNEGWRFLAWVAGDWNSVFLADSETAKIESTWKELLPPDAPEPAIAPFDAVRAKEHQEAWAEYLKLPVERDFALPGGEKLTMRLIPPGDFLMGSIVRKLKLGEPHPVRITRPFYLGKFEVTQAQWEAVMGDNPSKFKGPLNPVEMVSWTDIQPFLGNLNTGSVPEGMKFKLPTEAQWEYACRAGTTTAYSFGDSMVALSRYSWFSHNSKGTTHPVGEKLANGWDLHDMHGNVWEWCADWHAADYFAQSPLDDPVGPESGKARVHRGGGCCESYYPWASHSAYRASIAPYHRGNEKHDFGFRLVCEIPYPPEGESSGPGSRSNQPGAGPQPSPGASSRPSNGESTTTAEDVRFVECNAKSIVLYTNSVPRIIPQAEIQISAEFLALLDEVAVDSRAWIVFLIRSDGVPVYLAAKAVTTSRKAPHGRMPVIGSGKLDLTAIAEALPKPQALPAGVSPVGFFCTQGRVAEFDVAIVREKISVWIENDRSAGGDPGGLATRFNQAKLDASGFDLRLVPAPGGKNPLLAVQIRANGGETLDQIRRGDSAFRGTINRLANDKAYVRFLVSGDSFELYFAARQMVAEAKIPAGWEPVTDTHTLALSRLLE